MTAPAASFEFTGAFANLGRAPGHVEKVRSSMAKIVNGLPGGPVILGLNEIDEGDITKPSDHDLLRQYFRKDDGWTLTHMTSREPILLRDLKRIRHLSGRRMGAPGVKHQTPPRPLNRIVVPTGDGLPDLAVLCFHYAAGVHNGDRPAHVKAELTAGYTHMEGVEKSMSDRQRKAGRHLLKLSDRNWRAYQPPAGEHVVAHDPHTPDFITLDPEAGWHIDVRDRGSINLDIEALHNCEWVTIRLTRV